MNALDYKNLPDLNISLKDCLSNNHVKLRTEIYFLAIKC